MSCLGCVGKAASAVLGIGRAPPDVVAQRRGPGGCGDCKRATKGGVPLCRECGCIIALKTRLAEERCPLEPPRWEAWKKAENSS